jgi:hypothetical protein
MKYDEAIGKCEDKFQEKWNKLETKATKAITTCPDGLLQADVDVKEVIDECVSNVASGRVGDGLEECAGDFATCTTDVARDKQRTLTERGPYDETLLYGFSRDGRCGSHEQGTSA